MKKTTLGFSVAGSILIIAFLAIVNLMTSPGYLWFVYPAFVALWWPVGLLFLSKGRYKAFSVTGSILLLAFFVTVNLLFCPDVPWALFTALPVLWWPTAAFMERQAGSIGFALCSFLAAMLYYGWLNLAVFPGHPWLVYVAYGLIWWPMSLFFVKRRRLFAFSVAGALLTILFFAAVNWVTSPAVIWCVYPIFGVLWWPLAMYFFAYKPRKRPQAV
jgi:hypothetical protein